MAPSQIPPAVRRPGRRGPARARRAEDPQLRRMLATHIHCGEPMQLVAAPGEGPAAKNDGGLLTYRCACGFSFDHWEG